jgi:hypothetical protein
MNIEELKLILETIRSLSGDATTAVYWWFGLEFAKFVLLTLAGLATACWVVNKICLHNEGGASEIFMRECRDSLSIGDGSNVLYNSERRDTYAAIRKLIKESKQ